MRLRGQRLIRKITPYFGLHSYMPPQEDYRPHLERLTEYVVDMRPVHDKRPTTLDESERDLTITTEGLSDILDVERYKGARILEVGPKYGIHSRWLDTVLEPKEIVFCDLPNCRERNEAWKDEIHAPTTWVYGDLRQARELRSIEPFELVFFLGILYHGVYHIPLLSTLNRLTKLGGQMLLETTYDKRPDALVRLRWQPKTQKAKAMPTVDALRLMLAWTGWRKVTRFGDYRPDSSEAVFLCEKTDELVPGTDFAAVVSPHDTTEEAAALRLRASELEDSGTSEGEPASSG